MYKRRAFGNVPVMFNAEEQLLAIVLQKGQFHKAVTNKLRNIVAQKYAVGRRDEVIGLMPCFRQW